MSRKKHELAWHKKKGKFIPSSSLKPHHQDQTNEKEQQALNRRQEFLKKLSSKVKKVVNPSSFSDQ